MPIIGTAKIQSQANYKRGILVDREGYFVARVEWQGDKRPVINKKGTPKDDRRRLLSLDKNPNVANVPSESARWDFETGDWIAPPHTMTLIDVGTGQIIKRFKGFKEKLPDIPEGTAIVDDALPEARHFKPIYDKAAQAFVRAKRIAIIDPEGVVQNIVLENPNEGTHKVEAPDGWTRIDAAELPDNPIKVEKIKGAG